MNREAILPPNSAGRSFAPRSNGYRHRRVFSAAGAASLVLPTVADGYPLNAAGLIDVRAVLLGGGMGSYVDAPNARYTIGAGGGYAEINRPLPPGATLNLVVGAAGGIDGGVGTNTSLTVGALVVTAQAAIAGANVWNAGTGGTGVISAAAAGDRVSKGGDGASTANPGPRGGACAGSPWGDGRTPALNEKRGACWRRPTVWDLDDVTAADGALLQDVWGLGHGGSAKDGAPPAGFEGAGFGGGGAVWGEEGVSAANWTRAGGGGWIAVYW